MREFWVRLVSMLAIVGVLLGYNSVLDVRAKEDEIARLSAQVAGNGQSDSENGGSTNYKDGTYTGEADGFGGTIQVEVKIEKSKIAEINVISAEKEDGAYLSMAKDMIPKIIDAQERRYRYDQWCDVQLDRNQKCIGTGSGKGGKVT